MKIEAIKKLLTNDITHLAVELAKIFNDHEEAIHRQALFELGSNWVRNRWIPKIDQRPTPEIDTPLMNITQTLDHNSVEGRLMKHLNSSLGTTQNDELSKLHHGIMTEIMAEVGIKFRMGVGMEGSIEYPFMSFNFWKEGGTQFLGMWVFMHRGGEGNQPNSFALQHPSIHFQPELKDLFNCKTFLAYHEKGVAEFLDDRELHYAWLMHDIKQIFDPFRETRKQSLI